MHPLFHPLFIDYCAYFNGNNDYFECHEVLEEYWKEIAPKEKLHPLVGYVQLATGMYHWRRSNVTGAARIIEKAILNFELNRNSEFFEFIDLKQLLLIMKNQHRKIQENEPFIHFKLPITDRQLQELVQQRIKTIPLMDSHFIFNKHMLRDRTEILEAREFKKRSRQ
ncbi:uncharacterized conserved protein [Solibacillus silvestris StLB046]|uniref:Uncharacterized conserved protein n=1 Tax=Solibacillus silvestris (strain StLB046) TaxID=1002809 RepID=F2FAN7_SOLSS|nr:DUF309 domain-containing protein [Solibacillus silvestris]OBW56594.1 hypothetical protein A9986_11440 [Solibacillus silvestris]BAK17203.1 uncharacterized conserved protein [Solibacillus silvestris StLB046]